MDALRTPKLEHLRVAFASLRKLEAMSCPARQETSITRTPTSVVPKLGLLSSSVAFECSGCLFKFEEFFNLN